MSEFKVGDRVLCKEVPFNEEARGQLEKGREYIVAKVTGDSNHAWLDLEGVKNGWHKCHFEKVDPLRAGDIVEFTYWHAGAERVAAWLDRECLRGRDVGRIEVVEVDGQTAQIKHRNAANTDDVYRCVPELWLKRTRSLAKREDLLATAPRHGKTEIVRYESASIGIDAELLVQRNLSLARQVDELAKALHLVAAASGSIGCDLDGVVEAVKEKCSEEKKALTLMKSFLETYGCEDLEDLDIEIKQLKDRVKALSYTGGVTPVDRLVEAQRDRDEYSTLLALEKTTTADLRSDKRALERKVRDLHDQVIKMGGRPRW